MAAKAGKRGKPGGKPGSRRPRGRQRLWLVLFGAILVLLFVGFAVAQGIGAPDVPSGDVAIVEDAPGGHGTISEEDFERALEQQAAQAGLKRTPKPGTDQYEELQQATMTELLNTVWIRGQAEEMDITVTGRQIEAELAKIKEENFPTKAAFNSFLKESRFTRGEVDERVELSLLSNQIQERVAEEAPQPSAEEIQAYYESEKASQFTTPESRDVRFLLNEEKSKVEAAKRELERDNSPASWTKAIRQYSSNPSTAASAGLQRNVTEEFVQGALKKAIFESATGELVGPVQFESNYYLIEVVALNRAETESLAQARNEIVNTLGEEEQQEYLSQFVVDYESRWRARSYCASDFLVEQCANFKGSGHPASAPPACYEADPQTPAQQCPAPVTPIEPALPGTVTLANPEGERLVQRPYPEPPPPATGEEVETPAEGAGEGAAGGGGEGAEPPAEEAEPPAEEPESSGE